MSKDNIGQIISPFTVMKNGTLTLSDTNLTRLTTTDTAIREVRLFAPSTNAGTIHIGGDNLSTSNSALQLAASQAATISINNLRNVFIIATNAGDKINYVYVV